MELAADVLREGPLTWNLMTSFATFGNEVTDLGGQEFIPEGRSTQHREGFPLAGIFVEKVLSAEFVSGNRGPTTNEMCDAGTGRGGVEMGGPPVPCAEAPPVFWGSGEPTWSLTFASTFNLFTNWMLRAQIDARGGNIVNNDVIASRHTTRASTQCVAYQDDPICNAYQKVNRSALGFFEADFARLRELSLMYTVPDDMVQRFGMDRASVSLGWRNVALLWFPGKMQAGPYVGTKYAERTSDPEVGQIENEFGGDANRMVPPTSRATMTVRISF